MDACFGLTRKKTAGNSYTNPNHRCLKFADQDEVDNFVENYSKSNNIEGEVMTPPYALHQMWTR